VEALISQVQFGHLSNSVVSIAGGEEFGGVFDDDAATGNVGPLGMAGTQPTVLVPATKVPGRPVGQPILVNGVAYEIAETFPDGVDVRLVLGVAR
jgi:hypothetical protein